MKETTVEIRYKENPVLLDKIVQEIQMSLADRLPWLDYIFGRAYKLVEHHDDEKFIYPAAYNRNSEYVSLLPNDNFGNFCWFDIYDPQDITPVVQGNPQFTFSGALVFWYNLDSIYADSDFMYTEEIKNEIVQALSTPGLITSTGRLTINKLYERFENIYRGYSIERIYNDKAYKGEGIATIDKQYFMHPYAGLRVDFTITTRELCQRYIK